MQLARNVRGRLVNSLGILSSELHEASFFSLENLLNRFFELAVLVVVSYAE